MAMKCVPLTHFQMESFDSLSMLMKKMPAQVFLVPSEEKASSKPIQSDSSSNSRGNNNNSSNQSLDGSVQTAGRSNKRSPVKKTVLETNRMKGTSVEVLLQSFAYVLFVILRIK